MLIQGLIGLVKEYPDDDALLEELRDELLNSEAIAVAIFKQRRRALPERLPGDRPVNPYALSMDPSRWESDGVFDGSGITVEDARQRVEGIDGIWDATAQPAPVG